MDSLNADQPFDQFTTEQIAGDLLPGATPLQRLATGFSRNTLLNTEGGADPEEDRTKRVLDRAATIGTACQLTIASGAARLARAGLRTARLQSQASDQAAGDVGDLPAVLCQSAGGRY